MVQSDAIDAIPALPLSMNTKVLTLNNFNRNGYNIISMLTDTIVTLNDGTSTNVVHIPANYDCALSPDIRTVTTDVPVIIA